MLKRISYLSLLLILVSCGGNEFVKSPIDDIIKDIPTDRIFTVILNDMDVTGTFFHDYAHQYKIIEEIDSIPTERVTEWFPVSKQYFTKYQNNMNMEIAHRGDDGKVEKEIAPAGYNQYVGNTRYGHWTNRNGNSVWEFYGKYMFMSTMFRMAAYPIHRSYYNDYYGSYYGTGRVYYGPTVNGSRYYGTGSAYSRTATPNSSWSRNTSSFKNRVSGRTSRSSSRVGRSSSRSSSSGSGK